MVKNIFSKVECVENGGSGRFEKGKKYPIVSTNNGLNIVDEIGDIILFHNYGDEIIAVDDVEQMIKQKQTIMKEWR